jgi:hypothetical protein
MASQSINFGLSENKALPLQRFIVFYPPFMGVFPLLFAFDCPSNSPLCNLSSRQLKH